MGSLFGKIVRGASKLAKSPVGKALSFVPGVGTALTVAGAAGTALTVANSFKGGGGGGMPALPALPSGGGFPALPGAGAPAVVGKRGLFQNDPNIIAALQPFAISKANLRQSFRSPVKGYVVVRDSAGDPYALPKQLARKYAGWRPSKKPLISVGESESLKRADRTVKKVRKLMAMVSRVDNAVGKGGKVKIHKRRSK